MTTIASDQATREGDGGRWYVGRTKPRQEAIAEENLLRQGYQVYLPRLKVLKRACRRDEIGFEPFFPRYLFFKVACENQSIAPVRSTHGVSQIVQFGNRPAYLAEDALDRIRALESRQHQAGPHGRARVGDPVVVTRGPFTGLGGLVAMVAAERVTVLMRMLGEQTKVTLRPRELRVAA